jgi:hypothetical protein
MCQIVRTRLLRLLWELWLLALLLLLVLRLLLLPWRLLLQGWQRRRLWLRWLLLSPLGLLLPLFHRLLQQWDSGTHIVGLRLKLGQVGGGLLAVSIGLGLQRCEQQ